MAADIVIVYSNRFGVESPPAVIYVRPETNRILYERAIIMGVKPFASVIYMANLGGNLFESGSLIEQHYSSQFRFAFGGKSEVAKYPEMVEMFEKHFKTDFLNANIIGAFDAIKILNTSAEKLFQTFVTDDKFLAMYGQTIKLIDGYYIINYDMPALVEKHSEKSNVFVMGIAIKGDIAFQDINHAIFDNMRANDSTPLIDEKKLERLAWYEKMRRTYHFSRNHVMAMFDMRDFIFSSEKKNIDFVQTPLGNAIISAEVASEEDLIALKKDPLVYLEDEKGRHLVNIVEAANGKSPNECISLIKSAVSGNK